MTIPFITCRVKYELGSNTDQKVKNPELTLQWSKNKFVIKRENKEKKCF